MFPGLFANHIIQIHDFLESTPSTLKPTIETDIQKYTPLCLVCKMLCARTQEYYWGLGLWKRPSSGRICIFQIKMVIFWAFWMSEIRKIQLQQGSERIGLSQVSNVATATLFYWKQRWKILSCKSHSRNSCLGAKPGFQKLRSLLRNRWYHFFRNRVSKAAAL